VSPRTDAMDADVAPMTIATDEHRRPWGPIEARPAPAAVVQPASPPAVEPRSFSSLWEFALALNRNEPAALALATDGATCDIPIEGSEIRKLLGTVWFRSVFRHLSPHWRDRLLDVLVDDIRIRNHAVRDGRRTVRLSHMSPEALKRIAIDVTIPDAVRGDVQLVMTIGTMWGNDAVSRITFEPVEEQSTSAFDVLLQPFRHT
jgi:hypothetical protein